MSIAVFHDTIRHAVPLTERSHFLQDSIISGTTQHNDTGWMMPAIRSYDTLLDLFSITKPA
jgi:hypothetical protein